MLKKQPQVVKHMQKTAIYVGDSNDLKKAQNIRNKAQAILAKMQGSLGAPENANFTKFFQDEMTKFNEKTKDWPSERITYMTSESD